ncbi:MAG: hypothetical protein ACR2O2_00325 [Ruegeria sp.]
MADQKRTEKEDVRQRIYGGSRLLLESLSKEELEALHPMLVSGKAEIINEACRPYVIRKLPR